MAGFSSSLTMNAILVVLSFYSGFRAKYGYSKLSSNGRAFVADTIRLSICEPLGKHRSFARPEVLALGLMQRGCRVALGARQSLDSKEGHHGANSSYLATYQLPILADGYFFVIPQTHLDQARLTWTVEASADGGRSWTTVGASTWRNLPDGSAALHPDLPFIHRSAPGQTDSHLSVEVDLRLQVDMSWVVINVLLPAVNCFFMISCATAGLTGQSDKYDVTHKCWCLALVLIWIFGSGTCDTVFMWRESRVLWFQTLGRLAAHTLYFSTDCSSFLIVILIPGLSDIVALLVADALWYRGDVHHFAMRALMNGFASIGLIFAASMLLFRKRSVAQAQAIVLDDMRRYDQIWANISREPGLSALSDMVKRMRRFCQYPTLPRQFQSPLQDLSTSKWSLSSIFTSSIAFAVSIAQGKLRSAPAIAGAPVASLDQLFVQATLLHPILLSKVKDWAGRANGWFPSRPDKGFVRYCAEPDNHSEIKWAKLKTASRAIEKAVRVYSQVHAHHPGNMRAVSLSFYDKNYLSQLPS